MKMKYKILLLILGISLALSIALGSSYAMWMSTISQSGQNVVSTDCLNITLAGQNDISLANAFPITDSEAQDLEPYTFTITNKCNLLTDYVVNIETLNKSTLDLNFIKYSLDNNINVLGSIENNDSSTFINSNVLSSKSIATGSLKPRASKTYNLKFWIDESATSSDVELKTFASKIAVSASTGKNYVTLDAKGGQVEGKYRFLKYNKLESLPTPIKDGYEFQGWFSMDGSGDQIDTSSTLNLGDTIYARWESKTFNLTYDLDGGSVSNNPTSYTKESNILILYLLLA